MAKFDPSEYLIKVDDESKAQGYLEVKWRLYWFRNQYPHGTILTTMLHYEPDVEIEREIECWENEQKKKKLVRGKGRAVFHARIEDGEGGIGEGTKGEDAIDFPEDYLEQAETEAIGRALATLGYGIQFTGDEFKGKRKFAASSLERSQSAHEQDLQQQPSSTPAISTTPKEIDPVHREILSTFKKMVTKEELNVFLASTKIHIPTKNWSGHEFKQVVDMLSTYPIPVSMQDRLKRIMAIYGEQSTLNCLIGRFPQIKGKAFNEIPVAIMLQLLKIEQDARFYHELLSVYDPALKILKVKLQCDSLLQLFYDPEKEKLKGALYKHIVQCVNRNPSPLDKLSEEYCDLYAEALSGLRSAATTLLLTDAEKKVA